MVIAKIQEFDGDMLVSEFKQQFETENQMYEWLNRNDGHPFLYYKLVEVFRKKED